MKFSEHIRFRKERGHIFLCDCKSLVDFKLPLKYWNFLLKLQKGIKKNTKFNSEEGLLIDDFKKIDILKK